MNTITIKLLKTGYGLNINGLDLSTIRWFARLYKDGTNSVRDYLDPNDPTK